MGFIENNKALCMLSVLINTNLLLASRDNNVESYFFSSSACVYPAYRQQEADIAALRESDDYPAMPEDGYGWEKLFSERMCRHFREDFGLRTPSWALPQRLWALRHVGWRSGEGSRGHLPQGLEAIAGQAGDRNLGRRPTDAQLHVYRRLPKGTAHAHAVRFRRPIEYRQRRNGQHKSAGRYR